MRNILNKKKDQNKTAMNLIQLSDGAEGIRLGRFVFELLLSASLSIGCWYSFFTMFPNPMSMVPSGILIVAVPMGLYILCRNRFLGKYMVFYVFMFAAAMFLILYKRVWNGFLVLANLMIDEINTKTDAGLILFKVTGSAGRWQIDTLYALIPVMLLVGLGIAHSVYHKESALGFMLTLIPVLVGLLLKGEPSPIFFMVLIVSWAGLFAISATAKPDTNKRNKPLYVQKKSYSSLPYIFIGVTVIIVGGIIFGFSADRYMPTEAADGAKATVTKLSNTVRYEKVYGNKAEKLGEGDLSETHPMAYTDTTVFKIREDVAVPMHLRGFVGGYYTDGKWQESMEGAYSSGYTGITEWLAQHQFYPHMQQELLYRMSSDYDFIKVDVENINASSKYTYLPYEAIRTGEIDEGYVNYEKDYGAFSKGVKGDRAYSFKMFIPKFTDYSALQLDEWLQELRESPEWDKYEEYEDIYRGFVYDTYLILSDEAEVALKRVNAGDTAGKTEEYVLSYIREMFAEEFEYDPETKAAPEGESELEYFAAKSHRGGDIHFATLATLMFRQAGIPARYVEGYYLSPEEINLYSETDNVTIHVLDSDAHSWVEIYVDRLGWIPVEVVPGYYTQERVKTSQIEEDEEIKEENQKSYEDEAPIDPKEEEPPNNKERSQTWIMLLILIIVVILILLMQIIGRIIVKTRKRKFRENVNDDTVVKIYRHAGKLLKFDKMPIQDNPYDNSEAMNEKYSFEDLMTYREFIDYINRMSFGHISLTGEEQKLIAQYVEEISKLIYSRKSYGGKLLMKFVCFYI